MAKLYFRYSAMNSGKSTALIQAAYNYEERGLNVLVIKPAIDTKGDRSVVSRLGVQRQADILLQHDEDVSRMLSRTHTDCVLIDEAQFLTPVQVEQLFWFAARRDIPVLAYGLRTDFQAVGFPGASRLLELAHEIQELKTICGCGKKAVLTARKMNGEFIHSGDQVAIDGQNNVKYESLCANCYDKLVRTPA